MAASGLLLFYHCFFIDGFGAIMTVALSSKKNAENCGKSRILLHYGLANQQLDGNNFRKLSKMAVLKVYILVA